ncbi:phospholipase A2 [Trichonephila inaurata madagascariensis]|uniref:Phospholipase A2 n=1 Tax=Trichonephila inaurata madagascariensis TaxID=2747483 RepID=A0A8X6XXU3_9ARAC|nr:phospholipase A2 [Trichonephila inaurata madagascariensis]GFY62305.1 phospholipase A2 [Trichonephila inaurata madagascariensis]
MLRKIPEVLNLTPHVSGMKNRVGVCAFQVFSVFVIFAAHLCVPVFPPPRENIFVLQDPNSQDNRTVVLITWRDENGSRCEVFGNKRLKDVESLSEDYVFHRPSPEEMQELLDDCGVFSLRRQKREVDEECDYNSVEDPSAEGGGCRKGEKETETTSKWNWIFPGTKWCGAGNIAKNYDDLGTHNSTDMCCRAHDNCDDYMDGKATKYNLTNESRFTKLHCKCDDEFYDCLKKANTSISHTVGNLYFNVLKRTCYKLEHPEKCSQYRTMLNLRCVEYELDITEEKIYRWIAPRKFP